MKTTLDYAIEKTNVVFEEDLFLPESLDWLGRIEHYRSFSGKALDIFDYRRWQAKEMGLVQVELNSIVRSFYGESHTDHHDNAEKTNYDWVYNHQNGCQEPHKWQRNIEFWTKMGSNGLFSWHPFAPKMEWQCRLVKLNDLDREIPYGSMLRILEAKALNIFNCFHALEPVQVEKNIAVPDPIFLATMWELPPERDKTGFIFRRVGYEAHFFLSHWYEK